MFTEIKKQKIHSKQLSQICVLEMMEEAGT